jgi:hypothetical protein
MKWLTFPPDPIPYGSLRSVRKFAWWPKRCIDGYTVWLEMYEQRQMYRGHDSWNNFEGKDGRRRLECYP